MSKTICKCRILWNLIIFNLTIWLQRLGEQMILALICKMHKQNKSCKHMILVKLIFRLAKNSLNSLWFFISLPVQPWLPTQVETLESTSMIGVINSLWKKCIMRLHEWKGTHIHIHWLVMDKHKLATVNCSDNSSFVKSRMQLHQKREMKETVKVKKTLDLWSNLWS